MKGTPMSGPFFDLPDQALEADIATVAQKGGGKTYTNKRLVERLLAKGRRVCVLDPLNTWWGLQGRGDGSPGYPILVIGGPNADVPLDPAKGAELAAFVAKSDVSTVIDVSDLTKRDLITFATAFLSELYRLNRDALWLVLEESDVFAPQNPSTDGSRAMHDACDQIARRGRQRGFRLWTITQRPARLSKDLLTQASTLILLRIRGPQDRNAAADWVKGHAETAQAKEIVDSLASLPVGEGWVYSPDFDLIARVRFPPIETLDTSRTPSAGDKARKGTQLAKPDVDALRALMTTVGAEPPVAAGAAPVVVKGVAEAEVKRRETAARTDGMNAGRVEAMNAVVRTLRIAAESVGVILPDGLGAGAKLPVVVPAERIVGGYQGPESSGPVTPPSGGSSVAPPPAPVKAVRTPRTPRPAPIAGELSEGALLLLQAARQAHRPVTWAEAALLAGRIPDGGYYKTIRKELTDAGWGEAPPNDLVDEGPIFAPDVVRDKLGAGLAKGKGAAKAFFEHLWQHGAKTKPEIAAETGRAADGGFWKTTWKALRNTPRVVEVDGRWDIAPVLRELTLDRRPVQ